MDLNFDILMIGLLVLSILVVGNFWRDGGIQLLVRRSTPRGKSTSRRLFASHDVGDGIHSTTGWKGPCRHTMVVRVSKTGPARTLLAGEGVGGVRRLARAGDGENGRLCGAGEGALSSAVHYLTRGFHFCTIPQYTIRTWLSSSRLKGSERVSLQKGARSYAVLDAPVPFVDTNRRLAKRRASPHLLSQISGVPGPPERIRLRHQKSQGAGSRSGPR